MKISFMETNEYAILRDLRAKVNKTPAEHILLKYHLTVSVISAIIVDESKSHMSSEDAIYKIRECLQDNL